jgi:hypothetical protein
MVEPGLADRGDRFVADLARQIDAADLGTDRPGERADAKRFRRDAHACLR